MKATTKTPAITTNACQCGCGEATSSSRTAYKPGHDARHAGQVARDLADFWKQNGEGVSHNMLDELGSDKLRAKAVAMAERLLVKTTKTPQDRKPSKAASKKADAKAVATIVAQEEAEHAAASTPPEPMWEETYPVKVGRWTYPTRQSTTGTQERNTKRDGSGEWIAYEG
jgi:hypothetical protein